MKELDFESLTLAYYRLERAAVLLHSTLRRLAEKHPNGIELSLDDEQAATVKEILERMDAIGTKLAALMKPVAHEQVEPGRGDDGTLPDLREGSM